MPNGGGVVTFKYDPFGRRIERSGPSGTTIYAYDGANGIEELSAAGAATARYVQGVGIDEPLAESSTSLNYFSADGLGSITSLEDSTGTPQVTFVYGAFGVLSSSTGSAATSYRYTAREFDQDTGLYYYRARYYDPSAGRFLSEDPLRNFQGPDYYPYVTNSPANLTDPNGLQQQRPPNLPIGTPQQYWQPFSDAFAEALNRLNSTRCGEFFESSCHDGPYTTGPNQMNKSEYRFVPLPQGRGAGAQTVDSTHVQINSLGLFMTANNGKIRLPDGSTFDLGSALNVQALILLHELGHELKGNTGFTEDLDGPTNSAHTIAIIKACFE